jgi:hypothetical protein
MQQLLLFLPVFSFQISIFIFWLIGIDLISAVFVAALFEGSIVVTSTELFSLAHGLTRSSVIAFWMVLLLSQIAALTVLLKDGTGLKKTSRFIESSLVKVRQWSVLSKLMFLELFAMAVLVSATAICSAPNNYDSLTYHLPRVVHWIADKSLANYPTSVLRQLTSSPGAEFAICHNMLLSGDDHGVNLVQLYAFYGCIFGVIALSRSMKLPKEVQLLSGLFAASIPMAMLQGSSTQNDLTAAFWLVCLFYFVSKIVGTTYATGLKYFALASCAGIAFGLAALTKGTAYMLAFPVMLYVASVYTMRLKWRALPALAILAIIPLALNLGYFQRNIGSFGTPLDPFNSGKFGTSVMTESFGVRDLFSIFIRNLSLQAQTSDPSWNNLLERQMGHLLSAIHVGLSDPATSFYGLKYAISLYTTSDDFAGSPIHLLYGLLFLLLLLYKKFLPPGTRYYAITTACGATLFMSCLKWQPWNTRLELPALILFCPLLALTVKYIPNIGFKYFTVLLLFASSIPCLLSNSSRPLTGPNSVLKKSHYATYFMGNKPLRDSFDAGVRAVKEGHPNYVGLICARDSAEYLLSAALFHHGLPETRIEHMCVTNPSNKILLQSENDMPRFVFGIDPAETQVKDLESKGYYPVIKSKPGTQNLELFASTSTSRAGSSMKP